MVKRPSSDPAAPDAKWMSESAAIVFATTLNVGLEQLALGNGSATTHHWIGIGYHILQLLQEPIVHHQLRL
jgi:hypothetical protein